MTIPNRFHTSLAPLLLGSLCMINLCCSDDNPGKRPPAEQATKPSVKARPGQSILSATLVSELAEDCPQMILQVTGLRLATRDGQATQVLPVPRRLELKPETAGASVRSPLVQGAALERKDFQRLTLLLAREGHTVTLAPGAGAQPLTVPERLLKDGIPVPVLGDLGPGPAEDLQILFRAADSVLRPAGGQGSPVLHPHLWAVRLSACDALEGTVTDAQDNPVGQHRVTAQVPAGPAKATGAGTTLLRSTVTDRQGRYRLDALPKAVTRSWYVVTPPVPHLDGFYPASVGPRLDLRRHGRPGGPPQITFNPVVRHLAQKGRLEGAIERPLPADAHFQVDILQTCEPETAPTVPAGHTPAPGPSQSFLMATLLPDLAPANTPSRFALELPPGPYQVRLSLVSLGPEGGSTRAILDTRPGSVTPGGQTRVTFPR